jgi:hypothetical protein
MSILNFNYNTRRYNITTETAKASEFRANSKKKVATDINFYNLENF